VYSPQWTELKCSLIGIDFIALFCSYRPIIIYIESSSITRMTPEQRICFGLFGEIFTGQVSICSEGDSGNWILEHCYRSEEKMFALNICMKTNRAFNECVFNLCKREIYAGSSNTEILELAQAFESLRSKQQVRIYNRFLLKKKHIKLEKAMIRWGEKDPPFTEENQCYHIRHGWQLCGSQYGVYNDRSS
jgi:hypothetical protein